MSYCRQCRKHYREPPDEHGDHECPRCDTLPHERTEGNDMSDNESYTLAEEFVLEQIHDQCDIDVSVITVGDMRDCDCIPVFVTDGAGVRWDLVSVAQASSGMTGKLNATYETSHA